MKLEVIKEAGGVFRPANDMEYEKTTKFKTGSQYQVEIKLTRNPSFHRKVFAFFNFCYSHWDGGAVHKYCSELEQFDRFRKDLIILAGFYIQSVRLDGTIRVEAQSLSFANMDEDTFRECYSALIQVAMRKVFRGSDTYIYNKLVSFF